MSSYVCFSIIHIHMCTHMHIQHYVIYVFMYLFASFFTTMCVYTDRLVPTDLDPDLHR